MSKSLKRVRAALARVGLDGNIIEMSLDTKTAAGAAKTANCEIDQIAKSIIFQGAATGQIFLFVTAGGRTVDVARASELANEPLARADANAVRKSTGFAIGGVAPIGHLTAPVTFFDRRLLDFDLIWAAAGTPRHIFSSNPQELIKILELQPADFTSQSKNM